MQDLLFYFTSIIVLIVTIITVTIIVVTVIIVVVIVLLSSIFNLFKQQVLDVVIEVFNKGGDAKIGIPEKVDLSAELPKVLP